MTRELLTPRQSGACLPVRQKQIPSMRKGLVHGDSVGEP
jgi:hypothetical protein